MGTLINRNKYGKTADADADAPNAIRISGEASFFTGRRTNEWTNYRNDENVRPWTWSKFAREGLNRRRLPRGAASRGWFNGDVTTVLSRLAVRTRLLGFQARVFLRRPESEMVFCRRRRQLYNHTLALSTNATRVDLFNYQTSQTTYAIEFKISVDLTASASKTNLHFVQARHYVTTITPLTLPTCCSKLLWNFPTLHTLRNWLRVRVSSTWWN